MEPASIVSGRDKSHLDLRMLLRSDLQSAGVLASNIETMPHCPRCDTQTFFSHRGEQGTTGRFGLVAWWQ
jgi:copper oxidase (laccase) domain-containing protein